MAINLTSISVTRNPNKTEYFSGEIFDSTGLEITTYYYNDESKVTTSNIITDYTLIIPEIINNGITNSIKTVIVTYQDRITTFQITIKPILVTSISVAYTYPKFIIDYDDQDNLITETRNFYYTGEVFDTSRINVTANYNNSTSKNVTDFTFVNPNMNVTGRTDITRSIQVTYIEKNISITNSFSITIRPIFIVNIDVDRLPFKIEYLVRDVFNTTGLEIIGYFNNGSSELINDYSLSDPDMNSVGTKTITVTYLSGVLLTTSFSITIKNIEIVSIVVTKSPIKRDYFIGEIFSSAGLEITGHYNNGTSQNITNYRLSTPNMNIVGDQTVTITYENITTNISITIREVPTPLTINSEYWQHFRFQMPDQNLTLNLKWVERIYTIDFIYKERLVNMASLKDTNKSYDINYFNGKPTTLQQFRLPHNTYSKYLLDDILVPEQNEVELSLKLINEKFFINKERSFYKFGNNYNMIKYNDHDESVVIIEEDTTKVIVPKYSVKTFLSIEMDWRRDYEEIDFGEYSFFLMPKQDDKNNNIIPTTFTIWIGGARGGDGGDESPNLFGNSDLGGSGYFGSSINFDIMIDTEIELNFGLGKGGQRGQDGSGGLGKNGGGGGGGGSSYLVFNKPVESSRGVIQSIYCNGGAGANGGPVNSRKSGKGGKEGVRPAGDGEPGTTATSGAGGGSGGAGFSTNKLKGNILPVSGVGNGSINNTRDGFISISQK